MIVLIGDSGSGKSTVAEELEDRGYERIVTYTTRPKRDYEIDDLDYHFISEEAFNEAEKHNKFIESSEDRGWKYGCCIAPDDLAKNKVVILTPKGYRALLAEGYEDIYSVYLSVDRKSRLIAMLYRGDNIDEAYRRNTTDVGMFDGIGDEVNLVIFNDNYNLTVSEVVDIIEEQLNAKS